MNEPAPSIPPCLGREVGGVGREVTSHCLVWEFPRHIPRSSATVPLKLGALTSQEHLPSATTQLYRRCRGRGPLYRAPALQVGQPVASRQDQSRAPASLLHPGRLELLVTYSSLIKPREDLDVKKGLGRIVRTTA